MKQKNSIIILSGGMDSVTLLYDQKDYIALAVTFDYGSNHNKREAELAAYHCKRLGIEHLIIPLDFMGKYFKSSLLEGADAVPEGHFTGLFEKNPELKREFYKLIDLQT